MPINAGTRLGSYELLAQIGAGGMGEVYKAHDTKLGRDVAIKILPEAFAHDAERLGRFQREAKMLASLNHPSIATIHGLEQSNGTHYLVMELVSGETLADRIKREGAVPVEEALKIGVQIAEALEAAHENGIIHRDLKPANVKVTPEGKVKVLDFGLAKAFSGDSSLDLSNAPTLTAMATEEGKILGTPAYMSPEQTRGKPIDKRTDIWAFGCVLYELLTGKRAFRGETTQDTIAAILEREPDWQALPPATATKIRDLLRRCLQKDKALRMQAAGDARIEIVEALAAPIDSGATPAASASRSSLPWVVATAVFAIAVLALAALLWRFSRPAELMPLVRLDVDLGSDVSLGSVRGADAILSPDGTRIVYISQGKLFTRKLDQPKATELAGTEGAFAPFFSPDGQWVAFFAGGRLKKISVEGGAPVVIYDAAVGLGGSWGEDGNIIASLSDLTALSRVPSTGGTPTPVTALAQGEISHRWPQVLPGGKAVLFTSGAFGNFNIEVMSLKDRRRKMLQRGGTFGRYLATSNGAGHLVYINNGTLFAVAFDLNALEVRGTPAPVLEQVAYSSDFGSAQLDFSKTGMLLYRSGGGTAGSGQVTVQWLDSDGKMQPLLAKPSTYIFPRLSPDGQRLALEIQEGSNRDVWIYEWQRDTMTRLTFDAGGAAALGPVWSPDGRYIAFGGKGGIFWTRSDGAGKPQPLTQSKNPQVPFSFTPDGKRLAWQELRGGGGFALLTMPLESDGTGLKGGNPELFLQDSFDEGSPMFSPDGRWLAYFSNESGTYQVYVRAFPDKGGKWQISNDGGSYPVWSHNGRELFFRSDNRIMVAAYTVKGDSLVADKPRVWSDKRIAYVGLLANYDLAPNGKRVAALMPVETPEVQQAQNHVIFLENFFDELRRRVLLSGK